MQFKKKIIATLLIGSGAIAAPSIASANDSFELEQLRALVQELDQKVRVLARQSELSAEDAANKKKETPVVKASENGFGIESADGKNKIRIGGQIDADYRVYDQGANDVRNRSDQRAGNLDSNGFHDAADTAILRRVLPDIQGTLFGKYDFRVQTDFSGGSVSILDAYIDARFNPAFKVRAGKFKSFVGLERLQAANHVKFIERSYVTNAILPNRDLGIAVHGDVLGDKLNYAFGLVNGAVDGGNISAGSQFDNDKEYTARLFATPFKGNDSALAGLGFGIATTYTDQRGEKNLNFTDTSAAEVRNGLPSYVTNGQQTFFRYDGAAVADGKRFRIAPQANYYIGPLGIIAEYARVSQDVSLATGGSPAAGGNGAGNSVITPNTKKTLDHEAWQIAASYLLTGEDASFKGVKPKRDFDIDKGGWGAWELVARYSELNLDDATFKNPAGTSFTGAYADLSNSAKSAHSWTGGVNWYLNQGVKLAVNYEQTKFEGGAGIGLTAINAAGTNVRDRQDERALLARFEVVF